MAVLLMERHLNALIKTTREQAKWKRVHALRAPFFRFEEDIRENAEK